MYISLYVCDELHLIWLFKWKVQKKKSKSETDGTMRVPNACKTLLNEHNKKQKIQFICLKHSPT